MPSASEWTTSRCTLPRGATAPGGDAIGALPVRAVARADAHAVARERNAATPTRFRSAMRSERRARAGPAGEDLLDVLQPARDLHERIHATEERHERGDRHHQPDQPDEHPTVHHARSRTEHV